MPETNGSDPDEHLSHSPATDPLSESTQFQPVMASAARWSSEQFAELIKQLEQEGSGLLVATNNFAESLGYPCQTTLSDMDAGARVTPSLKALADISVEQKAIDDMRQQLEAQTREAGRLTKGMRSDSGFRYSGSHSILERLDIPNVRDTYSSLLDSSDELQYLTKSQLERELRECRAELANVRLQISESFAISEKQKEHFRRNIEELKGKLQETIVSRDVMLDAKKQECSGHEATVYKLQQTVDHLEQVNRRQEESILDLTRKQEGVHREQYVVDMSLGQLRSILSEQERRRGRAFYESDVQNHNLSTVVRSLEKCIQEMDTDIHLKANRINQLTRDLEEVKVISEEKHRLMNLENQDKLSQLESQHEKQLEISTERSTNAKHQVSALQDQIQTMQRQTEQQLRLKEQYITDLEDRLRGHQGVLDDERRRWKEKQEALEMACDDTQKELALLKKARDDDIRKNAVLESRYADMQKAIIKLEQDADLLTSQKKHLQIYEEESKKKEREFEDMVKVKDRVIDDLKKELETVKSDWSMRMQQTVSNLEKENKVKAVEELRSTTTQLSAVSEKCYKLTVDIELAKAQHDNLKEKYDDLKVEYTKAREQLQSVQVNKDQLSSVCQSRASETERLTQERDKYLGVIEDKNREIGDLKAAREKLAIQLEEREKNYLNLQQQYDRLNDSIISSNKSQCQFKDERDDLLRRMNEKIIETEELRHARDNLNDRLQQREKETRELHNDNVNLAKELQVKHSMIEQTSHGKEAVCEELRQSSQTISELRQEINNLQQHLEQKQGDLGKEINKLTRKLKATEHELKIAKRTLKTRENVDGTAVKVADKMQKEVTVKRGQMDSLQSRIRWLEECLETTVKEKKILRDENDRITQTVNRSVVQTDRLRLELQEYIKKNNTLREKINKMEAMLEKAAVKHAASQAKLEQSEQDMARLKLKHQLELKEIERSGQVKCGTQKTIQKTRSSSPAKSRDSKPKSPKSDTEIQDELKALILEMRSVLNTQTVRQPEYSQDTMSSLDQFPQRHRSSNTPTTRQLQASDFPSHAQFDSEISIDLLNKYNSLETSHSVLTSSSLAHPNRFSYQKEKSVIHPITSTQRYDQDSNLSEGPLDDSDDDYSSNKLRDSKIDVYPDLQTDALCKRLEKKIDSLSRIGGHLERENKEMTKMMRDQDKKLKKVKSEMLH